MLLSFLPPLFFIIITFIHYYYLFFIFSLLLSSLFSSFLPDDVDVLMTISRAIPRRARAMLIILMTMLTMPCLMFICSDNVCRYLILFWYCSILSRSFDFDDLSLFLPDADVCYWYVIIWWYWFFDMMPDISMLLDVLFDPDMTIWFHVRFFIWCSYSPIHDLSMPDPCLLLFWLWLFLHYYFRWLLLSCRFIIHYFRSYLMPCFDDDFSYFTPVSMILIFWCSVRWSRLSLCLLIIIHYFDDADPWCLIHAHYYFFIWLCLMPLIIWSIITFYFVHTWFDVSILMRGLFCWYRSADVAIRSLLVCWWCCFIWSDDDIRYDAIIHAHILIRLLSSIIFVYYFHVHYVWSSLFSFRLFILHRSIIHYYFRLSICLPDVFLLFISLLLFFIILSLIHYYFFFFFFDFDYSLFRLSFHYSFDFHAFLSSFDPHYFAFHYSFIRCLIFFPLIIHYSLISILSFIHFRCCSIFCLFPLYQDVAFFRLPAIRSIIFSWSSPDDSYFHHSPDSLFDAWFSPDIIFRSV